MYNRRVISPKSAESALNFKKRPRQPQACAEPGAARDQHRKGPVRTLRLISDHICPHELLRGATLPSIYAPITFITTSPTMADIELSNADPATLFELIEKVRGRRLRTLQRLARFIRAGRRVPSSASRKMTRIQGAAAEKNPREHRKTDGLRGRIRGTARCSCIRYSHRKVTERHSVPPL